MFCRSATFFCLNYVPGFRRSFSLTDTSILHTYTVHERVPNYALYLICFVSPLILQPMVNLMTVRSWWDFHNGTLGLILSLSIAGAITQFSKITVGRPRPDLVARCIPKPGSVDPIYGLSTQAICTQTDESILRDGFRSFPSGHSSLSFAGLGFLSFYLAGKLHLFDERGYSHKAWISLTPLAGAALVAISRTMDYRHHWHDVVTGSLLGLTVSYFGYRQYFPSLSSPKSHRPHGPRIKEADILPSHRPMSSNDETVGMARPYSDTVAGETMELEGPVRQGSVGPFKDQEPVESEEHKVDSESGERAPE